MINLGKLVQHKSNDKVWRWVVVIGIMFSVIFFLLAATLGKTSHVPKNIQKIPPTKMSTWGTTSMKNDSIAYCSMQSFRSYPSVKTCIISKPFTWFAKHINCLQRYFRTDYNIVCVQGNVHRPLVSWSYNHGVKMIFFTRRIAHVLEWLYAWGKGSCEYQIKYVSRPRMLAEYQPNGKF